MRKRNEKESGPWLENNSIRVIKTVQVPNYLKMPSEEQSEKESGGIALLKSRLGGFETEQGRLRGLSYPPRAIDVAISTTPKAGTTWLQQVGYSFNIPIRFQRSNIKRSVQFRHRYAISCDRLPAAEICRFLK